MPQAPPPPADDDLAGRVALAQALADGAGTLAALAEAQQGYDGIELKKGARNFCFADGNPKARVLILGEAPGDEEDRQGRPSWGARDRCWTACSRPSAVARRGRCGTRLLCYERPDVAPARQPRPRAR
ncbi:uracil-DNA glycosylase family protein [Paracoccus marcusii]|nr:uracil-DNA glycosylase family protein [Paracoccus marcusii]